MIQSRVRTLAALTLLAAAAACDRGDVVVFAAIQAGTAGLDASAGSGGDAGTAGASDGRGGSAAGSAGAPSSGASGNGGEPGDKPCQTADDCGGLTWLCQRQNCGDTLGVCLPRPVSDDPLRAPVCGCDRITYFNDTLRQQYGISSSRQGECKGDALPCDTSDDCGPGGSCSHRLPGFSACSVPGTGQCWVAPNDCSSTSDKPHFLSCPPPGAPPGPKPACLTTCQALQSGDPYVPMPPDYVCP